MAGPTIEPAIGHFFTGHGLYARSMLIQRGTVLVGRIHKEPQIFILAIGRLSLMGEKGTGVIDAPYLAISPPGVKRAGYAHVDSLVITVHKTDLMDEDGMADALACKTYEEYLEYVAGLKEGMQ